MRSLILPVKQKHFEQIEQGSKTEVYRAITPHWKCRLENKDYDQVVITLCYPPKKETSKRLEFPFKGITRKTIQHEEFGPNPCEVYAIPLKKQNAQPILTRVYS